MKTDPAPGPGSVLLANTIKSEKCDPNLTSPPPLTTTQTPPAPKETGTKGQKRRGRPPGLTKVKTLRFSADNFYFIGEIS